MIFNNINNLKAKLYNEITEIPELLKPGYISSLNGLRTLSIIFVLFSHLIKYSPNPFLSRFVDLGNLGVYIFFVISGFLITTLLIKEKVKTGDISLKGFYVRRFFRIIPLSYVYPIVILILNQFLHLKIPAVSFISCFFFIADISYFKKSELLGHYWSLSVEEQFYLIFPPILKKSFRWYLNFLFSVLFLVIVFRNINFISFKFTNPFLYKAEYIKEFLDSFDGIIIGSFLAILTLKNAVPFNFINKYKLLLNVVLMPVIIIIHCRLLYIPFQLYSLISSLLIAIFLISNIPPATDVVFKFLNNKIVSYIGMMSFSVYIWQQIFTLPQQQMWGSNYKYLLYPWVSLPLTMVFAYLSFNYFEKFFLKLKPKKID